MAKHAPPLPFDPAYERLETRTPFPFQPAGLSRDALAWLPSGLLPVVVLGRV